MHISRLTALLVTAAVATTAGCGGDKEHDKTGTAGVASTDVRTATTTTSPTATTAKRAPTTGTPKGSKNDPAPGRVIQAYFKALSSRDGAGACDYMGEVMKGAAVAFAKASLKDGSVKTCADALERIVKPATAADLAKIRNVDIISSTVAGSSARVKVKNATRDATLTKIGDRWIITGGIFGS